MIDNIMNLTCLIAEAIMFAIFFICVWGIVGLIGYGIWLVAT